MTDSFSFIAIAISRSLPDEALQRTTAHTDGLTLRSEDEPGWPSAYKLIPGRKYQITIQEVDDAFVDIEVDHLVSNTYGWMGIVKEILFVDGRQVIGVLWMHNREGTEFDKASGLSYFNMEMKLVDKHTSKPERLSAFDRNDGYRLII